jgi:hypothetical protein
VINADDFYGAGSYRRLAAFLAEARAGQSAIVGFRLANTLSENGTVSRGVCLEREGRLVSITEEKAIAKTDVGDGRRFTGNEVVSMNFWGFTPAIFGGLEAGLRGFLKAKGADPGAEFYLPAAVSRLIAEGLVTVSVLPGDDAWFGITYREDRPRVEEAIRGLVDRGRYPSRLFP